MYLTPTISDMVAVGNNWRDLDPCPADHLPSLCVNVQTSRKTRSPPDYGGPLCPDGMTSRRARSPPDYGGPLCPDDMTSRRAQSPPDYGGPSGGFVNFVTSGHDLNNALPNFYLSNRSNVQD